MAGVGHTAFDRKVTYAIACLPAFDCVVNQLANGFGLTLGSISLLQMIRFCVLLLFAVVVVYDIAEDFGRIQLLALPAIGALLLLLACVSKEWIINGRITSESMGAYGQMAYWVMLWMTVSVTCRHVAQAMLLLYGLAAGAILTAASVLLGFVSGGLNYYKEDLVHASSGWFNTAKMITGILVCGTAIILYLGCGRKHPWRYAVAALACATATFVTYARAGVVALTGVLLWLALWAAHVRGFRHWRSLKWFFAMFVVYASIAAAFIPEQAIFSRWNDLSEGQQAGSGRAAIWTIAAESVHDAPPSTQLLGRGYGSMSDLLFRQYGDDVRHTHNDTLDMLLVGGVIGLVWLTSFIIFWIMRIAGIGPWSLEGAAAIAVFIDYLCHGQLTGQLWGTDAMTYYVMTLTAYVVIAARQRVPISSGDPVLLKSAVPV